MKEDNKTDKATPQIDDLKPRKDAKGGGKGSKATKGSQTGGLHGVDNLGGTKEISSGDLGSGR